MEWLDDKLNVIWCLTAIALFTLFLIPEPAQIVQSIVSGLLGVAVGRGLQK